MGYDTEGWQPAMADVEVAGICDSTPLLLIAVTIH